jgi:FkbM family methyltransferase
MYAARLDRLLAMLAWKIGLLEDVELALLPEILKPGMTAVDVGANMGLFTLEMAGLAGEAGRVIAFEPDPVNLDMLRRNLAANRVSNVDLIPKAVSDHSGKARLFIREEHSGDSRIFDYKYAHNAIDIETVSLDDLLAGRGGVDFIKIDTQGAECKVLAGMRRLAAESKHLTMFCEYTPAAMKEAGGSSDEFFALVEGMGLSLGLIAEDGRIIEPITKDKLEKMGQWQHSNLILRK